MAKGKKKESLTPEERLQAALVPESEQPYPVPANWCWTRIGDILRLQAGKNISASKISKNRSQEASFPCFGGNGVRGYVERYNHDGEFPIIGRQGALCGNVNWASGKFYATEHAVVVECSSIISKRWAYRILFSMNLNQYATATAQPGLSVAVINQVPIALPPAQEQQRIADRIESLFAKLDEAKQKAQDALDSFETRKAAILHKAFTGELTAQWRKEHGVGIESWEKANLGKYVDSQYGYTESASQEQVGPKFLRITDIQDGVVNWANVPFCKISDTDFERYAVSQNDIMIARTGATTGKSYLIVDDVTAVFASYLIRIKIKSPKLQPQYLYGFMQSQMYWGQITEFSAGIAQPGVNAKKLKEIILPIPFVPEQVEIVRIIDALLAKEQQAKEAAEGVLEQIDLIKKSILARAFRGELGTNDPNEESAVELVKRVIERGEQA